MKRLSSALTAVAASVLVATAALAQEPTAPTDKPEQKEPAPAPGAPGASRPETPPGAARPEAEKPDAMKETKRAPGREQVRAVQQALKDKGHDPGPIDGIMGPKTREALKGFQKAEGIKETGRLDAETMAKLGVEARAGETGSPAASPRAPEPGKPAEKPATK